VHPLDSGRNGLYGSKVIFAYPGSNPVSLLLVVSSRVMWKRFTWFDFILYDRFLVVG